MKYFEVGYRDTRQSSWADLEPVGACIIALEDSDIRAGVHDVREFGVEDDGIDRDVRQVACGLRNSVGGHQLNLVAKKFLRRIVGGLPGGVFGVNGDGRDRRGVCFEVIEPGAGTTIRIGSVIESSSRGAGPDGLRAVRRCWSAGDNGLK